VPDEYVPSNTPFFTPQTYGANSDEAIYVVEGIYTFAESGESVNARLYLQNGNLVQVFCNTGDQDTGAPREITPQQGDLFAMLEKWIDDPGGNPSIVYQNGSTLVFDAGWPWMGISFPFTRKLSCSKVSIFWRKLTRQHRFCRRIGNHIQG